MAGWSRRAALAWTACVVLLSAGLAARLWRGVTFETSVLALLPADERDPVLHELATRFQGSAARTLLLLVGHVQPERAGEAAAQVEQRLIESGHFDLVAGRLGADGERAFHELYFPLRYQMLSPRLRAELQAGGGPDLVADRVLDLLQGPMSGVVSGLLPRDPLLLHAELLRSWSEQGLGAVGQGGFVMVHDDAATYAVIATTMAADPFDADGQRAALDAIESIANEVATRVAGTTLDWTGVPRFAARVREQMKREMSWIGLASTLGTALFIWLVFRSVRPLLLSLLPMVISVVAGTLACLLVFPEVHLMTLVFGTTLTGMGVDYALHYFCVQRTSGPDWNSERGVVAILPGITVGMLTSAVGFSGLYFTPFPVLRQFALFSSVGLAAAWATVVAWYPALSKPANRGGWSAWLERPTRTLVGAWARRRGSRATAITLAIACVAALLACWVLPFEDDVRRLQNLPPDLVREDARVRALAGRTDDTRFVLVQGASEEETLQHLALCSEPLRQAVANGEIAGTHGLAAFLPSRQAQQRDHELLAACLLPHFDRMAERLDEIGFETSVVAELRSVLETPPTSTLDVGAFLASPASRLLRPLWLGAMGGGFATTILLRDVHDAAALEARIAPIPGARYVDRVRDLSALMRRYRVDTVKLVAAAYAAVLLILLLRFGFAHGLRVMLPAVLSASATLVGLHLCGADLTLFHLLGLLLVLGLAVDYGAFVAESGVEVSTTMLALVLSTVTAGLAFGWMAFSSAAPLRAIGTSVSLGLVAALMLAPFAWREEREKPAGGTRKERLTP